MCSCSQLWGGHADSRPRAARRRREMAGGGGLEGRREELSREKAQWHGVEGGLGPSPSARTASTRQSRAAQAQQQQRVRHRDQDMGPRRLGDSIHAVSLASLWKPASLRPPFWPGAARPPARPPAPLHRCLSARPAYQSQRPQTSLTLRLSASPPGLPAARPFQHYWPAATLTHRILCVLYTPPAGRAVGRSP